MGRIINLANLQKEIAEIKKLNRPIVLVGGCFDILHVGHIKFLKEAKQGGEILIVLLESDQTVTRLKGKNRPYFSQKDRAEVLSSIKHVDYVIMIPPFKNDEDYNNIISIIAPSIIAVTAGDAILEKKKYQATMVGGKIRVIPYIKTYSSSQIAKLLGID